MERILIIGATSAIAEATARLWVARGAHVFLVGRDGERLARVADDLRVRAGSHGSERVHTYVMDALDTAAHPAMLAAAGAALGGIDIALIAHGTLPDQAACAASVERTLQAVAENGTSVIALAGLIANAMEARGAGTLAVISSVAGDRGRQSNYVYGAAKGMVSLFLAGLRNRLAKRGVHVLTIKPGFVDTPMTAAFKKGALWATPAQIARGIVRAVDRRANEVYLPGFWRLIMLIIRHIPEAVFKRLSL